MRKSDVDFHSDGMYREAHAAANVKVRAGRREFIEAGKLVARDNELGPQTDAFIEAWEAFMDADDTGDLFGWACESGWEQLQSEAEDIFAPADVQVYSEGRSGGWAVVGHKRAQSGRSMLKFGVEEVESWDAIALGRWARFVKAAQLIADGIPYDMASLFLFNVWETRTIHGPVEIGVGL